MGRKHVLFYQNRVDFGIDFSLEARNYSYDKDFKFSYDGAKYNVEHTNTIIFSDDFKIENHLNIPSRTYSGYESIVTIDDGTVYLFGTKDNMMSIDKLTGL